MRGHNTGTEGNLHKLMLLRAEDDPKLREWLKKSEYTSPATKNELITLMGQQVLRKLLAQIRAAFWFGIIADKATDVSHNKQLSISIRWISMDYIQFMKIHSVWCNWKTQGLKLCSVILMIF